MPSSMQAHRVKIELDQYRSIVTISFANREDAKNAIVTLQHVFDAALAHNVEFLDATEALYEHTEELAARIKAERPFLQRMRRQEQPSGVD